MDYQVLFNITSGIAGFVIGFIFSRIFTELDKLDDDVSNITKEYVNKEDYRHNDSEIKEKIRGIFRRLDNKVDK